MLTQDTSDIIISNFTVNVDVSDSSTTINQKIASAAVTSAGNHGVNIVVTDVRFPAFGAEDKHSHL
jgi:hypothetical protein